MYAYLLNTYYDYKIDNLTILYVPRNLKKIIPIDVPVNFNRIQPHLKSLKILYDSLLLNQVPSPENYTLEECQYCLYSKFCDKSVTKNKEEKLETTHKSAFLL